MYIKQAYNKNFNFILYLIIPLAFLGIIVLNYFMSSGTDTQAILKDMIDQIGHTATFVILVGPLSIGCIFLLLWVKIVHNQTIRSLTTSRKKVDWSRILFSFFVWGIITVSFTLIFYFINPDDYVVQFNLEKFLPFAVVAIILIPLQTSFEEYLFRGYLMQGIGIVTRSRLIPLIITSVVFGLMHVANPEVDKLGSVIMIYYIGTGFFLGIMTLMDDGLELALGFHAANNLIGALLITADWTAFQTHSILKDVSEPSAVSESLIPVFIIFPILLYIFGKKYGWKNWKEKLMGSVNLSAV
ncbi:MAG: CPBP family intramembrane glutamic endopeptidase [Flavobacteriaceae bacterium]|jgi:membrane protease YdiL (CAAX protease family)|nr:CPBP family intramembrane glutamic endopeptidase [Flavobacteriaceae bacterium]